ncbi:MAG: hypothetical protein DNFNHJIP_00463 [Candidatus Argoarchaeum ethanivorans]|uniref:Glycosyltransferase 2-like domain-containing protein n=1 Tax=Candidatus Argoarchaeum ethanivorans TaxID=2608793 RepID=A0A811ZZY7_9EURY|nr:MAG: hypothetical protein DNFNHJIP_00463 [Candidatus Argoarchaeum ethanivorans]
MDRVAVLITCHNRKDTTLICLKMLYKQRNIDLINLDVYLVDDGSTDGTKQAVANKYKNIKILEGDGKLYWCGGMRLAWSEAMKTHYDAYLWLNDDTLLYEGALMTLITTWKHKLAIGKGGIIVGTTCDSKIGKASYGGYLNDSSNPIEPLEVPQRCDLINGNIVLVPNHVFERLGNLSNIYTHSMGDKDYSLRAGKKGIPIWVAPGFQGECKRNSPPEWTLEVFPLVHRFKILHSPKGLPPREYRAYLKLRNGNRWPLYMIKLYLRVFIPQLWRLKRRNNLL